MQHIKKQTVDEDFIDHKLVNTVKTTFHTSLP